jgi:hypothetical protein
VQFVIDGNPSACAGGWDCVIVACSRNGANEMKVASPGSLCRRDAGRASDRDKLTVSLDTPDGMKRGLSVASNCFLILHPGGSGRAGSGQGRSRKECEALPRDV